MCVQMQTSSNICDKDLACGDQLEPVSSACLPVVMLVMLRNMPATDVIASTSPLYATYVFYNDGPLCFVATCMPKCLTTIPFQRTCGCCCCTAIVPCLDPCLAVLSVRSLAST